MGRKRKLFGSEDPTTGGDISDHIARGKDKMCTIIRKARTLPRRFGKGPA